MSSREKILDAYEALLIEEGERAASLNAIAARASVSKGGLLYHFPDKTALIDGLLERAWNLAQEDFKAMATDPDGPSSYYVRTSLYMDAPFDRVFLAISRLRQDASQKVVATYARVQEEWFKLILAEVGSQAKARAILLLGDGLYYNAVLASEESRLNLALQGDMEALLGVVDQIKGL